MLKKSKSTLINVYSALIVPLIISYLFPMIFMIILGKERNYYSLNVINGYTWAFGIFAAFLIACTNIIKDKKLLDIIFYIIGIIIGIASYCFLAFDRSSVYEVLAKQMLFELITGYLILILGVLFQINTVFKSDSK